ncbi:hypothetical protein D9M69_655340 [compost metagenome]
MSALSINEKAASGKADQLPHAFPDLMRQLQVPGTLSLSSRVFSKLLHISIQQLATLSGVHRSTLQRSPDNPQAQQFMRECLQVIRAAEDIAGDLPKAIYWFKNEPLRDFGYRTPEQVVADGKTSNLLDYLESVESGSQG